MQPATTHVLDVGTGNGVMLHRLVLAGFRTVTATDYVHDAVTLARANLAAALEEGRGSVWRALGAEAVKALDINIVQVVFGLWAWGRWGNARPVNQAWPSQGSRKPAKATLG